MTGLSLVLLIVVVAAVSLLLQKKIAGGDVHQPQRLGPSPRHQLEFESGEMARDLKSQQRQELDSYQWQDDKHRFAKIPVSRALELYLQKPQLRERVAK
jgi:hypothetical protein